MSNLRQIFLSRIKALLVFFSILLPTIHSFSQAYEIPLTVRNLTDSMIFLGHHYGNGYFVNDSLKLDKKGTLTFKGANPLSGGIYFIILPGGKLFEFLIDKNQKFGIQCDTADFLNTVKFKNSFQNDLFYQYQKFLNQQYSEINRLKDEQKKYITKIDTLMMLEDDIQLIYNKIYLRKEEIISQYPDSLFSAILKAGLPVVPPPAPTDEKGNMIDSSFAYKYVKIHFFDNINFSDSRLLGSAIIQNKILEYLTKMCPPHYDSIIAGVDFVAAKAQANSDVYKFVMNSLFQYYNKSNIISDENVFVHIAENYFLAGKTPWVLPDLQEKLTSDLKKRRPNLIGKLAPDFKMKDNKGKLIGLRETQNKHTILYFYDVDCEICKLVSPELMNLYRIIKDRGVNVFGIFVGKDKAKWDKYIAENNLSWINVWDPDNKTSFRDNYNISGTPLIYLLDEDQKIVAKKITVEQLMGYFNSL